STRFSRFAMLRRCQGLTGRSAVTAMLVVACAGGSTRMVSAGGQPTSGTQTTGKTIAATLETLPSCRIWLTACRFAGVATDGPGPLTLFVPTDAALGGEQGDFARRVYRGGDQLVTQVVRGHVANGRLTAADLLAKGAVK